MAFFSSSNGKRLCMFEIRPNVDFVVFRGDAEETSPYHFKGHVIIMTSETIQNKGVKIALKGKRRTAFYPTEKERPPGTSSNGAIVNEKLFLNMEYNLSQCAHIPKVIRPGNHEFPFEFTLSGDLPESIEGMYGDHITYSMKATIDKGVLAKDLIARRHLRIIRTLGHDSLELQDPQDVHGLWPDKLKYSFSTSSKAVIYGTALTTDIELTPLLDKLRIGRIKLSLKEIKKTKTLPGPDHHPTEGWIGMWKTETIVAQHTMELPQDCGDTDSDLALPNYRFKARFDLPKSLKQCRQSVERGEWIQIKHMILYEILLHNPDGHMSELKAHHQIKLFISPQLPVGEDNSVSQTPDEAIDNPILGDMQTAPPLYENHRLDRLYDDIDPTGFQTPGLVSGMHTPFAPGSFSRSGSSENLAGLGDAAHPLALHNRLTNLQLRTEAADNRPMFERHGSGGTTHIQDNEATPVEPTLRRDNSGFFNRRSSPPSHSGGLRSGGASNSRLYALANGNGHNHGHGHGHGQTHQDENDNELSDPSYDMPRLERLTSYTTAIKTPVRSAPTDVPPTYENITSRPPSPNLLQMPMPAHIARHPRSGHGTPSSTR